MRNYSVLGLVGVFLFLGGCVSYSAHHVDNDEQVDLYLSTLDDKHFVWCELDLAECRKDFEKWKFTPRGQAIIREYEREAIGQTYNTHQVSSVFRTRFVNDNQLAEELGEHNKRQSIGQDSVTLRKTLPFHDKKNDSELEETPVISKIHGPELP